MFPSFTWTRLHCPLSRSDLPHACLKKRVRNRTATSAGSQSSNGVCLEAWWSIPGPPNGHFFTARLSYSCSPKSRNNLDLTSNCVQGSHCVCWSACLKLGSLLDGSRSGLKRLERHNSLRVRQTNTGNERLRWFAQLPASQQRSRRSRFLWPT